LRQQPSGDHRADDADNDIADQPKTATADDLAGDPARDRADDEPGNDRFNRDALPSPARSSAMARPRAGLQ